MAGITMYGAEWCGDCRRSKRFLERHGITYEYLDTDRDPDARAVALEKNRGRMRIPVIVFPDGSFLTEPSDEELARKVGVEPR